MGTICEVERIINEFWESAPSNSLHLETGKKSWAEPHVAIARGDDPLFLRIKEMIGPFLWTPEEAYALAFPESPMPACELRVISYVLPQTSITRADQRLEDRMPAERWARSRFHGEGFNCDLRLHLAETLTRAGYPSVAPERLPGFGYQHSERFGLASNWSERHAAFVAGHGTFGLSDGMITRWGKAVRFGSVVPHPAACARLRSPARPRYHQRCSRNHEIRSRNQPHKSPAVEQIPAVPNGREVSNGCRLNSPPTRQNPAFLALRRWPSFTSGASGLSHLPSASTASAKVASGKKRASGWSGSATKPYCS